METITSEPAVDPTHLDWWHECREKSIAGVLQSEDTVLSWLGRRNCWWWTRCYLNKMSSEALDSLDTVKCFAETHADKHMNVMLN